MLTNKADTHERSFGLTHDYEAKLIRVTRKRHFSLFVGDKEKSFKILALVLFLIFYCFVSHQLALAVMVLDLFIYSMFDQPTKYLRNLIKEWIRASQVRNG
jgi:hypothetical protein